MGAEDLEKLKEYILSQFANQHLSQQEAKNLLMELYEQEQEQTKSENDNDIAIIGMSCKFAECDSPSEYWSNLVNEKVCMITYPTERKKFFTPLSKNAHYAEFLGISLETDEENEQKGVVAGYIKDVEMFDAKFFGIQPREAKSMDPAHRLFLESAWSAIEDAGYSENMIRNTNTGVYVGKDCTSGGTYYRYITEEDAHTLTGTWHGILASRLNYLYNLRGPSMVLDTACSSGLMAVHEACQALRLKECEMAIAGGISLGSSAQGKSDNDDETMVDSVSSSDNTVRTFDRKSTGTVFGEGIATLLLKPLTQAIADGDNVYAVIKSTAANNDGASNGITSPNPLAQEDVIVRAWEQAGINPETVNYVEAHGTGTILGDPIEFKGLTNAFKRYTDKKQFCGIGSVKTNIGHLVGASGIAGIMKIALALQNKKLPASLHFEEPNPHINFVDSPLYVVDQLQDWTEGEVPRRAGVSAFGFSGTNLHVLLEEAPKVANKTEKSTQPQIVALSGKSENVIMDWVKKYHNYLETNTTIDLEQLAYTANTGRGHYEYRLVFIVSSLQEFKQKIAIILANGLNDIQEDGICYARHKVVSDKKKDKDDYEISEIQKREITSEVNDLLQQLVGVNISENSRDLHHLAKLYTTGASVDWNKLYDGKKLQRITLPVYPFEKIPYWGEIKVSKLKNNQIQNTTEYPHPLVEGCLIKSIFQDIYTVKLNVNKQWELSDHVLFGVSIVPGVAYLEIASELASRYYEGNIELTDVLFLTPIVVKENEDREIHFLVQKEKEYLQLTVTSQDCEEDGTLKDSWTIHTQVKMVPLSEPNHITHSPMQIRQRPDMHQLIVENDSFSNNRVRFGPRWLNVDYVARAEKDVFAELRIPQQCQNDLILYKLHPGMLDNAVNAATQTFGDGLYLPLSYKSVKIYGSMPSLFYTHIRKKDKDSKSLETLSFDISLFDENGNAFAEIKEYTIKKVQASALKEINKNHYYQAKWVQEERAAEQYEPKERSVVVLKDSVGFAEKLITAMTDSKTTFIEVEVGSGYQKLDEQHYQIDVSEESYMKLFEELQDRKIDQILHLFSVSGNRDLQSYAELQDNVEKGVTSLFNLSRATVASKLKNTVDLVVMTDYAYQITEKEEMIHPHNAALLGLAKVVAQEFPNLLCRSIDMDHESLHQVVKELHATETQFRTAFRENRRYIEQFGRMNVNQPTHTATPINDQGAYIITGGMGGIGLAMTAHLAARGAKNICLLNRSSIPAREDWEAIIYQNEDPKLVSRLLQLKEIEEAGTKVQCYSVDICNENVLSSVLTDIRERFGSIHGILHGAGVAGDGFLILKEKSAFEEVLKPKINGTWLLDRLTREDDLDFFVAFSSMTTLFGSRGQGDYTAANSYLDSFAHYRTSLGKPTSAINWPGWKEVGMAVDFNVSEEFAMFTSIPNEFAFHIFDEVISLHLSNVIPGELNIGLLSSIESQVPMQMSLQIKLELSNYRSQSANQAEKGKAKKRSIEEILLTGKGEDEYTATEQKIAFIYAQGLDLDVIDIYENFNALGGDSIMATELLTYMNVEFPGIVDISDMFSYATVAEMATYIDSKTGTHSSVGNAG